MSILSKSQALRIGIESIEKRTDIPPATKREAIQKLQNMASRDWYIDWDRESIVRALYDYKERTGKAPTVTNLTEAGMPKSLTIKSHFHMSASLFLKQLFPENRRTKTEIMKANSPYGFTQESEWVDCFRKQFEKHKNENLKSKNYNALRDEGTPTWETIARRCGIYSWTELMHKANVKYPHSISNSSQIYVASVSSPTLDRLETLNKERARLNAELYEILEKI